MGKRNAKAVIDPIAEDIEQNIDHPIEEVVDHAEQQAIAEIEEQIALPRSVVKPTYKVKYRDRAREAGVKGKAAKRSAWDWLAQSIAAIALDEREKLKVGDFLALLDANGVDHSRWQNRSPGWEGRLRMTGRLALQKVVAEAEVLMTADGEELVPPAEWVAKFRN
jgi:hypothetical protein